MITWPTWLYDCGVADFTSFSSGLSTIGISRSSVAGGAWIDVAVTVFSSTPLPATGEPFASSSACVNVWLAVQVIDSSGARVVSGHARLFASLSSLNAIPVSVTLPAFVTRYEYCTVCGAVRSFVGDDFTTSSSGFATAPTVTVSAGDVTTPFVAEATFTILPASRSACVTVYDAVQVSDSPGASPVVGGQITTSRLSLTKIWPGTVTLPVFVTTYV